jgi:hypothetical protein
MRRMDGLGTGFVGEGRVPEENRQAVPPGRRASLDDRRFRDAARVSNVVALC